MNKDLYDVKLSDSWHIEEDEAWFVDGLRDRLYYVDLELNMYEYIADIPNTEINKFRLNPRCFKNKNEIYLMPERGSKIWVYNLDNKQFVQIVIDNPDNVYLYIYKFWIYDNNIYALSVGLQTIIEINIREKVISNYFTIPNLDEIGIDNEEGIRVEEDIYFVSSGSNRVYQFNLESKQITTYVVPMVEGGLCTISFDGRLFWLTGFCKEIYLWDKENNSTKVLSDFPQDFGIYVFEENSEKFLDCTAVKYDNPAFIQSISVGNDIWFIPFQTNKIIYVDTETYQLYALEIDDEEENSDTLFKKYLWQKYLVQYIREERYIGLFSLKNNYIIEIDTVEKSVKKKSYGLGKKTIENYICSVNGRLKEDSKNDRFIFSNWLMQNEPSDKEEMDNVESFSIGTRIYHEIQSSMDQDVKR